MDPLCADCDHANDAYISIQWANSPVNRPEDALLGIRLCYSTVDADVVISDPASWVFTHTNVQNGDHIPGLLGYEVDSVQFDTPPGTKVLAHSAFATDPNDASILCRTGPAGDTDGYADMVIIDGTGRTACSTTFSTGTIQWSWGLDDFNAPQDRLSVVSPVAEQVTRNVLAQLAIVHGNPTDVVYVDQNSSVPGSGSCQHPYELVSEGVANVSPGGTLILVSGSYPERVTIARQMTIYSAWGRSVIGE